MFRCERCGVYEFKESELKDHIEEKHHGLYLEPTAEENNNKHEEEVDKESVEPKKQKQRDSIWSEKCANAKMFKCDRCDFTLECENEFNEHYNQMHIKDHHSSNSDPTVKEGNKHETVAIGDSDAKDDASKMI